MKRGWLWLLIGIVGIVLVGGGGFLLANKIGHKGEKPDEKITVKKPSPEDEERFKIEQVAHSGMAQKAGEIHLKELRKLPEGWFIALEASGDVANLEEALEAASQLFKEFKLTGVPITKVSGLLRTSSWRGDNGRQIKDLMIMRMGLKGSTLDAIEWRSVDPMKLPTLADDFWAHPWLYVKERK